jgi:hypothetical protein
MSATVIPLKPTTRRPAIVRRRSTAGLADATDDGLGLGEVDGAEGSEPVGVGTALGVGVRWSDDGRHAAAKVATVARAAARN